jgi:O-antigen/teichoic acid export membrane protein
VIALAGANLVLQSLGDLTRSVSLSTRRGDVWAIHAIAENLGWLIVIAVLLALGSPLSTALLAGAAVMLGSFGVGLVVVNRLYGVEPSPRIGGRDRLGVTAPFAAYALLGTAYLRSDTLLVAALVPGAGLVAAGAYYAAVRLLAAFEYIPEATSLALLPELSETFARDPASVVPLVRRAARLLVMVAVPVPFLMVLISGDLLQFLFGPELSGYGWVLALLSVLVPIRCYQWLAGTALTGSDQQSARAKAMGAGLLALLITDVALIPQVGVIGAVAGSAIGLATVVAIYASRLPAVTVDYLRNEGALWSLAAAALALGLGALGRQAGVLVGAAAFVVVYLIAIAGRLSRIWAQRSAG